MNKPWEQYELQFRDGAWSFFPRSINWETRVEGHHNTEKKVIDWAKVPEYVPVRFGSTEIGFLRQLLIGHQFPFRNTLEGKWSHASLETGLWVANVKGVNPWPEGVLVERLVRKGESYKMIASSLDWSLAGNHDYDIIASRCAGLQEGWGYG